MIQFDNITKRYANGYEALKQIRLKLQRGEMAFLTGHSGAGKSTLLKLIALIERPSQGNLYVNDHHLNKMMHKEIPDFRRSIGVVFQNPHLLHERTIFENVALPLHIIGMPSAEMKRRVRAALDKVGLLKKEKAYPSALSTGQQQRIGIARAIVHKPAILLADEPTGNLDPDLSLEIMRLFQQFNQLGTTVLIATHDLPLIARFPNRILTLKDGLLLPELK